MSTPHSRSNPIPIRSQGYSTNGRNYSSSSSTSSSASSITTQPSLYHIDLTDNITYLAQFGSEKGFIWNEEVLIKSSNHASSFVSYAVSPSRLREERIKREVLVDEIRLDE